MSREKLLAAKLDQIDTDLMVVEHSLPESLKCTKVYRTITSMRSVAKDYRNALFSGSMSYAKAITFCEGYFGMELSND